jgi:hypothetical protein
MVKSIRVSIEGIEDAGARRATIQITADELEAEFTSLEP